MNQIFVTFVMILSASATQAAPLADLSAGETGRIEFEASNPPHRWALIRGQLGPKQTIYGDLLMPKTVAGGGKVPVMVMSHGSDGITSGMLDVWAKPLNDAGFAVFMVDSFTPRNSAKIGGTSGQLTWNTTVNISDAIYALKILSTHPSLDASRIYHMGWSRGGNAVTGAMWPSYRQQILNPAGSEESKWFGETVKWAGSIALYPGCNLSYRNGASKITSPVLYLLGEKDDMTPAQPCVEEAQRLIADGNPVTYKVYPGAYHVFDRLNQPWRQGRDGSYAACALDVAMPTGPKDVGRWGPGYNRATGKTIETPQEFEKLVKECGQVQSITIESNTKAREQAVQDVLNFVKDKK